MNYYYDERERHIVGNVGGTFSISLSTIGIITGIVLCILKGCGTLDITWFWATFPFWIVPASTLALLIIGVLVGVIVGVIAYAIEKRKK